ncbi:uncharacterized protein LOC134834897 [Culicoides brevitarsis]|uniref:uncharacterized protein LOC134834897 n=1 Tax=Culicoides brevitarsis TaxID=469753 RepID=UPI00307C787E
MWSRFEPSAIEDETINNAFSTNGLFKIGFEGDSEVPLAKVPHLQSIVQNEKMVIAIEKSLYLMKNENAMNANFVELPANFDCFCVTSSGNVVISCLADGSIIGVHIDGNVLFNLMIDEEDVSPKRSFAGITMLGTACYALTVHGKLYRLSNVDEKMLTEATGNNESQIVNETLLNNVIVDRLWKTKYEAPVDCHVILEHFGSVMCIFSIKQTLLFYYEGNVRKIKLPKWISGLKAIYNLENYVVGLTVEGEIFEICPSSKLISKVDGYDFKIEELIVMDSNSEEIELLCLTKPDADNFRYVKILTFPFMICKNELTMETDTWLVDQSKCSVNMYYVSGERNAEGYITEIEMKIISETEPELRLKKLIQREHFDEAEEFAKQFELSLQPIYEAKARKLCNTIAFAKNIDITEPFNELYQLLQVIESPVFFSSIAEHEFPNRNIMKKFLEFVSSRLNSNEYASHIKAITEKLLRLETLHLIDPNELYTEWRHFVRHTNLFKFCKEMFRSNFGSAQLIWSRHTASFLPYTCVNSLSALLNSVPETVEPFEIVQWLKHFTPSVLQLYPHFMTEIVDWSILKTKSLQYSPYWPEIGLEFANNIVVILKDVKFLYANVQRKYESCIEAVDDIIMCLEDLSILKKSYNLNITLDDYIKETMEDTAYNLLQRVQLSNFNALVTDFLYPIFNEKCLSPENAIKRYIHYLTLHNHIADWAERSVTAVELLHNENDKYESTLMILKASPVPWSPILNQLMKYGDGGHHLAQEIYVEYKNQAIKVLKKKYGWPLDLPGTDLMLFVKRIVMMNFPEMLDDVRKVLENAPEITVQANIYVVLMLTEDNLLEKALDYLKNVKPEYRNETNRRLVSTIVTMLDNGDADNVETYLELLKTVASMTNSSNLNVKNILKVLCLRDEFKISVNLGSLYQSEVLLKQGIAHIVHATQERKPKSIFNALYSQLKRLCSCLGCHLIDGILAMCRFLDEKTVTMNFIVSLLDLEAENSFVPKLISLILLALKQELETTSPDDDLEDLFLYPILHQMLEKVRTVDILHVFEVNELFQWTMIGYQFYKSHEITDVVENYHELHRITEEMLVTKDKNDEKDALNKSSDKKNVSLSVFEEISSPLVSKDTKNIVFRTGDEPNLAVHALSTALKTAILSIRQDDDQVQHLWCHVDPEYGRFGCSEDELKTELVGLLEKLIKNKQHMRAFLILQRIRQYKNVENEDIFAENTRKSLKRKILKAVITQKRVDYMEGLNVLISEQFTDEEFAALKEAVKISETFTINFYTLLEKYFHIQGDERQVLAAKRARITFSHHQELCRIDESLKYKKSLDFSSFQDLSKELKGQILPTNLLQRMSRDFGWDYEETLIAQIINLLSAQKLEFDIAMDVFGKEEIRVKTTVEELVNLCQPYVNEIQDRAMLAKELKQSMKQFNFYFYELYLCTIKILEYIDQLPVDMILWQNVLTFLIQSSTARKNRAGQTESDWWFKTSPDGAVLPKIAKYRVPFYPLISVDLKEILDSEICVDNCEKWLPLIELVSLIKKQEPLHEIEYFCMAAVKNSVNERKTVAEETGVWHLTETNDRFLQGVLRLTDHMQTKHKITFLLYFTMNYSPEGIDQVNAAQECYNFVLENEEELMAHPKAKEVVVKMKQKYPILKTQHLLHQYGLVEDHLMILAQNPSELIQTLYKHESILHDQKVNINRLCEEIAILHKLDFDRIQTKLVEKWLGLENSDRRSNVANESTMFEETTINNANEDGFGSVSDENIVRAYFILKSWDTTKAMTFLMFQILDRNTAKSTGKELQLVECYTKLSTGDHSDMEYGELISADYYNVLKCVHHMSQLGYKMNKEKFKSIEKLALLKEIWKKHADDTRGLELIVYICLGFEIYEPQVWNGVLKQMIAKDMTQQLQSLVVILSSRTELLHVSGLASAWMTVIKAPFVRSKSDVQDHVLAKSLILLQSCPLTAYLDYIELTELALRLGRAHIAALFMAYANEKQMEKIISLLKSHVTPRLKEQIQELKEFGVLPSIIQSSIASLSL